MPALTPIRTGYRFGSSEQPLEYAHPPLIEVWLGVEFAPPTGFDAIEGTVWRERLGPEWPSDWQSIGSGEHRLSDSADSERQLRNGMGDRAIRFGRNGFRFGWLGHDGSMYPRYEAIRDGFVATLDAVRDVMPKLGLPTQWSISYANRIPQGTVWTTPADWTFFRLWQPNPLNKLKIEADGFVGRWQFPLEAERGTIAIELSHDLPVSNETDPEVLWLRITTSGPTETHESSLFDGLDYGRETIVRAFGELVTSDSKQFWGALQARK
jgi:uncharacterized protein (TIGR04255 family)